MKLDCPRVLRIPFIKYMNPNRIFLADICKVIQHTKILKSAMGCSSSILYKNNSNFISGMLPWLQQTQNVIYKRINLKAKN